MKHNVVISYEMYYSKKPQLWIRQYSIDYKCTSLIDDSGIGISVLYTFSSAEDANAFKLMFS